MHPTKREVHFLDEEAITEKIADALQEHLTKESQSRTFEYQVCSFVRFSYSKSKSYAMLKTRLPGTFLGDESSSRKRSRRDRDDGDSDSNAEAQTEMPTSSNIKFLFTKFKY